jgi:hypothetical protein
LEGLDDLGFFERAAVVHVDFPGWSVDVCWMAHDLWCLDCPFADWACRLSFFPLLSLHRGLHDLMLRLACDPCAIPSPTQYIACLPPRYSHSTAGFIEWYQA